MKRKLFNAALFAAVVVAAPVGTFVSCADYDSDIENLQGQVTDIQTLLDQKVNALNEKIAALEAQDKELEAAYKAADEALKKQLSTQISDLDNKLSAELKSVKLDLEAQIAACKAECAAQRALLQQEIDSLKGRVASAEGRLDTAEGNITNLLAADIELQNGIAEANNAIATLKTRVDALETGLSEVSGKVAALESDNTTNKADIAALKADVTKLQSDVAKLNEEIGKVREEFAAADAALKSEIEGKLSALWTQVNANKDAIAAEKAAREAAIEELKQMFQNKADFQEAVGELEGKDTELAGSIGNLSTDFGTFENLTNDEIKALKERMDAVEGQVSVNTQAILDLTARVLDLYAGLDELQVALDAALVAQAGVNTAQTAAINAIDGRVTDLDNKVDSLYTLLTNTLNALQGDVTANKTAIDSLKAQADSLRTDVNSALSQAATLRTDLDSAIAEYKALDDSIYAHIASEVDSLNQKLSEYATKLSKEVKGFVLVPDNYYQGIQAIEGVKYVYNRWNVEEFLEPKQNGGTVEFCPEVVATYNVNPSTAVLSPDAANYTYTVEDRVIRGGNNALKPVVKSVDQNGGVLTVKMKLTDPAANTTGATPVAGQPVTVMALQYKNPAAVADDNQVVTSDYAALYLSKLDEVYLLDKDQCTSTKLVNLADHFAHTWRPDETQTEVLMPAKKVELAYNATEGFDVSQYILVRFGWKGVSYTAENLPEGFTLEYKFEDNQKLFTLEASEGSEVKSVVKAKEVLGNIGKHAELRVAVKNGDNVAEVGYFDFYVKGEAVTKTAAAETKTADYVLACDLTKNALDQTMSTNNVWNLITETLGITTEEEADEAKDQYDFVRVTEGSNTVAQYCPVEGSSPTEYSKYSGIGTVTFVDNSKLQWTVTYQDLADLGLNPLTANASLTTYVLVRSDEDVYKSGKYNEFYLPLTWKPAKVEEWGADNNGVQTAHWNYNLVPEQWQGTQDYELRLYADLTKAGTAPYKYNIPAKAFSGIPNVELSGENYFANYNDFVLTNGHYVFVDNPNKDARVATGVSGKTYSLTVSPDGSQLLAVNYDEEFMTPTVTPIVEISNEGVIELNNNVVTQDILNAYEKDKLDMGQTLAAYVSYAVECCAGPVQVAEGFNVRFLKPVTVLKDVEYIAEDADGATGIVKIDLAKSIVCFTGKTFKEVPEYFDTFDLQMVIKEDKSNWTTDYNGGDLETTLLTANPELANLFKVVYDPADEIEKSHPYITFQNNTAVLNEFKIRVPLTITHVWGTMTWPVDIVIGRTIGGNSNGRK